MIYQVLDAGHVLDDAISGESGSVEPGGRLINSVW
jgi:hypothetical protein